MRLRIPSVEDLFSLRLYSVKRQNENIELEDTEKTDRRKVLVTAGLC